MRVSSGQRVRKLSAVFMLKIGDMNVPGNESKGKFYEIKKIQFLLKKTIVFLK